MKTKPKLTGLTPEQIKNLRAFLRLAVTETPLISERITKGSRIAAIVEREIKTRKQP